MSLKVFYNFFFAIIFIFIGHFSSFSQTKYLDSLKQTLPQQTEKQRAKFLYTICFDYANSDQNDSAFKYGKIGLKLAYKLKDSALICDFYSRIGLTFYNKTDFDSAMFYYEKGLAICKRIKYEVGLSIIYTNAGLVYWDRSNLPDALRYFLLSFNIDQKLNDKNGMAADILNIGLIYDDLKDYDNALKYYTKALELNKHLNNASGMADAYKNMAVAYQNKKDPKRAVFYDSLALSIAEKISDKRGIAMISNNIGTIFFETKNFTKAKEYYQKSLKIYQELNNVTGLVLALNNLGDLSGSVGKYAESIDYFKKALDIALTNGLTEDVAISYNGLAKSYSLLKDFKNAYQYHVQFKLFSDSLVKLQNTNSVGDIRTEFEVKQKETEITLKKEKQILLVEEEKRRQKIFTFSALFILLIIIAFSIFLYKRFKITIRQKAIIEKQKHLVEEKQKEVLDSISYAKRIQNAILATEEQIKTHLPNSFLLYKPKDIVAGDFYFFEVNADNIFYAAADCTGHGVPGALVSMVCSNALTRCVKEFNLSDPGLILDKTRELILETFRKSGQDVKDGMDISLCVISKKLNQKNTVIKWAGANNPLWYIQSSSLLETPEKIGMKEITANKQPIGQTENPLPFTTHTIELSKYDTLYLLTDGFADQFGGPKGKKFKYKQLTDLLLEISNDPLEKQKEFLDKKFEEWKGELEQVDDVCIIGIRF